MMGVSKALMVGLLLFSVAFGHGEPERSSVTLIGEVIDLTCFVAHGARGADNAFCAEHYADVAQPVALLIDDGELYILAADESNRFGYEHIRTLVGDRVRVEGLPSARDGLKVLEVRRASKIKPEGES